MMTRSSSESALVNAEDGFTYVVWMIKLLEDIGFPPQKPIKVYQDNLSTIIMAGQGGKFKRTKQLICKKSYIRERLQKNDMVLLHLPTKQMLANLLTKPVPTGTLKELPRLLCLE
jgi:hypothetical protein